MDTTIKLITFAVILLLENVSQILFYILYLYYFNIDGGEYKTIFC